LKKPIVKCVARAPFTNDSPKPAAIYEALMLNTTRAADKGMRKQFE
jgi:hypothetical protein